jgi:hypothetical protein
MGTTFVYDVDLGSGFSMLFILVAMLVIVMLATAVVLYVAFPHRGEEVPHAPWVGDAMRKGVNRLPTIDNQREHQHN